MKILAIDTSCDETSAAVSDGARVLSNVVYSQVEKHRPFGGVVPNIAKREHQEKLPVVIESALKEASVRVGDVDVLAVTYGPGLAMALEVGITKAKELARKYQKTLVAVDHMEGHLLSSFAKDKNGNHGIDKPQFPALGLLVSGGHTELVLMKDFGDYELAGQTLDDAAGEAFDKVARLLGLPYPGGPEISRRAKFGDPTKVKLPIPMRYSGDLNFSYAGLKTAAWRVINQEKEISEKFVNDFCASFEYAAIEEIVIKLNRAIEEFKPKMVLLGGGVVANERLQKRAKEETAKRNVPLYMPFDRTLLLDNAGMIAVAAYFKARRNDFVTNIENLDRKPRLEIGSKEYA